MNSQPTTPRDPAAPARQFDVLLTVDTTMSKTIRVQAANKEEAYAIARQQAADSHMEGFEQDENYRRAADFYVGDSVENSITEV
jgi:hypothetical protein